MIKKKEKEKVTMKTTEKRRRTCALIHGLKRRVVVVEKETIEGTDERFEEMNKKKRIEKKRKSRKMTDQTKRYVCVVCVCVCV